MLTDVKFRDCTGLDAMCTELQSRAPCASCSWVTIWRTNDFLPFLKGPNLESEVAALAERCDRMWVRTCDDHSYGAKTREKISMVDGIAKHGTWPLDSLRDGKAFSKPRDGGDATKQRIEEAWEGSPKVLEHLWNRGVKDHDLSSRLYHASNNSGGLHLGNGRRGWTYHSEDSIEVLLRLDCKNGVSDCKDCNKCGRRFCADCSVQSHNCDETVVRMKAAEEERDRVQAQADKIAAADEAAYTTADTSADTSATSNAATNDS